MSRDLRRHPAVRATLGVVCLALLASCTSPDGSPSPSATPAPVETSTATAEPASAGLRPAVEAGRVPTSGGEGPAAPTSWPVAVLSASGLSVSTSPVLKPKTEGDGTLTYEVYDISAGDEPGTSAPRLSASGARSWQVPDGTMTDGRQYAWRAQPSGGGEWIGPYIVDVDATRPSLAPRDQFAGVSTHLLTGVPSVTWTSRTFPTVRGGALAVLDYSSARAGDPWLPPGWRMTVPLASRWTTFQPSEGDDPQSVYIADVDGRSMTFTRNESGVYAQTWANGRRIGTASSGILQRAGDLWRLVEVSGDITEFRGNRPVAYYRGGTPTGTVTWSDDGRLVSATDPSGREITFGFGTESCPDSAGFDPVPDGFLCAISWWDGTQSRIHYVDTANGPQVGLIADAVGGAGPMSETGLGLGWDQSGRIAAVRSPLVNAAVASGAIAGDAVDVLTQITYDREGRVQAVASPAPEPGAERLVHTYRYPAVSERDAVEGSVVTAVVEAGVISGGLESATQPRPVDSAIGNGAAYEIGARASDWRPVERRDRDGARTRMTWDEQGRKVESVTDYEGRVTTFQYADERRSGFVGPSTDAEDAYRQETETDRDAAGDPLRGLTAYYWSAAEGAGPLAGGGWIARNGRLEQSWDSSPTGTAPWSGMFTGTWTTKTGRDKAAPWVLEVRAGGAKADVYVDNRRCELDSRDRCRLELADGRHFLRIDLSADEAEASLRVSGDALDGEPQSTLPELTGIEPGFGLTTELTTNDRYADGKTTQSRTEYAEPWTGLPTSVETAGGLVSTAEYEPAGAAGWGRRVSSTTPGGLTSTTEYWPLTGADEASPCGGPAAPQAGQVRAIRRTDGVIVRRWYDAAGRTVAIRTGDPGDLACWSFAADGSLLTSSLVAASGDAVEETTVEYGVGGDPRVARTTVRSRPLGGKGLGDPAVTETRVDLLGRLVSYVDLTGVTFAYRYDVEGNQVSRTTSLGDATLVTSEQEFDATTGRPTRMLIDGQRVADIDYDGAGRVTAVTYASGVSQGFRYRPNGTVDVTGIDLAGGGEVIDRTSTNEAGRVFERLTQAKGLGDLDTVRTWSYVYDGAARLKIAELEVVGDQSGVGAKAARFDYGFGEQDASCAQGAANPGADLNRTTGSRNGTDYVTCYDAVARAVSTTDPLLSPEGGAATLSWDGLGRLERSAAQGAELSIAWSWGGLPATINDGVGQAPVTTELAHALGRLVAQRSTTAPSEDDSGAAVSDAASGVATRMAYANPTALAPSVLLDDAGARQVRLLLPGGALWTKTIATGDVVVDHPGIRGEVIVRTDGKGKVVPGPGGGALAETLGPFGEPVEERRVSAGGIPADPPRYGYGFARLEPTLPGGTGLVLATARPYLPALGAYLAFDPDPGASTTGYGYAEADPVNYSDPTGAYSWFDFARNVLAVVSIAAAAMIPGAQWYVVLAISLATSGGQLAITAAERDAQGLELTTTDFVMEGISVALDMAFIGSGKGVKSAWQAKKAVTESVDEVSEELASSALRLSGQPANEAPSLLREVAKATVIVTSFQLLLGGGGDQQAADSGAQGQDQGGADPQDCPVEGGCEGMPSREGQHRVPDRL